MKTITAILILCSTATASPPAVRADGYTLFHSSGPLGWDFTVHYATIVPWEGVDYYHPCFHMVGYKIQLTFNDEPFKQGGIQFVGTVDGQEASPEFPDYGSHPVHVINAITRKDGDGTVTVTTSSKGICGVGYVIGSAGGPPLCLAGGISIRAYGTISSKKRLQFEPRQITMDIISQPCIMRGICTGHMTGSEIPSAPRPTTGMSESIPAIIDPNRRAPWAYMTPDGFTGWLQLLQQDDNSWSYEPAYRLDTASLPEELLDLNEALNMVGPYVVVVENPLQGRYPKSAAIVLDGRVVHCTRITDTKYISDYILPKDEGQYVKLLDKWNNTIHCFPVENGGTIEEKICDVNLPNVLENWLSTTSKSDLNGDGIVSFSDYAISALR